MNDGPMLFGTFRNQAILGEIHLRGAWTLPRNESVSHLAGSGLVVKAARGPRVLTFDTRHPAYKTIRAVLAATTGKRGVEPQPPDTAARPFAINPIRPLAHTTTVGFRILNLVSLADGEITPDGVARRIPDVWAHTVIPGVQRLVGEGVLAQDKDGRLAFASGVPPTFVRLVGEIATHLGRREIPHALKKVTDKRPVGFNRAADGAPLLFGTDAVLRNFMALAKHGPLDYRDLRRATGAGHVLLEGKNQAPFGRGAVVRVWKDDEFEGVMLDPAYPVYAPLRRLLLQMVKTWPIAPMKRRHRLRAIPPPEPWNGDTTAVFGSTIPTAILMSIGVLGWTFESLCCAVATGKYREAVKGVIPRLEEDGILQGSRPRGPGANVRVLTIADSFPAKAELEDLLRACVVAWPYYANTTRSELARISPKTRAHLRKRGLL